MNNISSTELKDKVHFIEDCLSIPFKGHITNKTECQLFIDEYYEDAVFNYNIAKEAYYGEFMY